MKYKDILQNCIQDAADAFKPAIPKCILMVVAELQEFENKSTKVAERQMISAAWVELHQNAQILSLQFNDDLLESINLSAAIAAETIRTQPEVLGTQRGAAATLSAFLPKNEANHLGNLSLVDDADVSHAISSTRFLQQIMPKVDARLEELNKLVSAVQGLPTVRADLNPLRPEVFVQTFIKLIATVASEPAIGLLWITHFAKPLALEINALYGQMIERLTQQSVQPLQYKVLHSNSSASANAGPGATRGGRRDPAALQQAKAQGNPLVGHHQAFQANANSQSHGSGEGAGEGGGDNAYQASAYYEAQGEQIESNADLLRDFMQQGSQKAHYKLPESYYASQQEILSELMAARASQPSLANYVDESDNSSYVQMPVVDRPARTVDAQSQLNQKVWGDYGLAQNRAIVRTQLKTQAKEVGQVMSLEMVRKLVNKVAQDSRLLGPVREAIVALEPALLRLAMVDPRFFSDENHPARRLMERAAQRSFKYNDEFSEQFQEFFTIITGTFNQLNSLEIENALPFQEALVILDVQWAEQDKIAAEQQARALAALRFAEKRQSLAGEIAFEISHRPDLDGVPGLVLDFLFESWSLAMAHARLIDTKNQIDPEGFNSVVFDLLWSVKRSQTIKQPSKLVRMIPLLLSKLNQGLDLIGKDRQESQVFLNALMKLHQPVLNLLRAKTTNDAQQSEHAVFDHSDSSGSVASPEQRLANMKDDQPWLAKADAQAFGFEDAFMDTQDDPVYASPQPDSARNDDTATNSMQVQAPDAQVGYTGSAPDGSQDTPTAATEAPHVPLDPTQAMKLLQVGGWVDLQSQDQWMRAQLIWVNDKNTLFMFSSHGGQPHSMTRRRCERLLAENLLRPLQTQGVVERALDSVQAQIFDVSQTAEFLH
jgi:Protein of unknown function (DUF1631)